jgi:NSS family neurotransmitter:Na+ symporter
VVLLVYVCGLPSALNVDFLGNQDFVWGVALMLAGGLVAFVVTRHGAKRLRRDEILASGHDLNLGAWWDVVIQYVVPSLAILLLVWWLSLSATVYSPDDWYDPFNPSSVMTCLVQWGLAAAVLLALNRQLAAATASRVLDRSEES